MPLRETLPALKDHFMAVVRSPGLNAGHFYSNIVMPIEIDCNFVVDSANGNGLGIRSLKSNGYVQNVFMHTSATPGTNNGYLNPNPAAGYALVQFKRNFNAYLGGFSGFISPTTGSSISISGSGVLTAGNPYIITAVGAVPAPHFSVTTVADVSGSLAGLYMTMSDAFSHNFVLYNVVSGVGLPPALIGPLNNYVAIPVSFASGSSAATVASALATAINGLNFSSSFTTSVLSNVVTVTSAANANLVLSPGPAAATSGFTVSSVVFKSLAADWESVGVPLGLTPAVGMSFIATATGSALGTGTVMAPGISLLNQVQVVGDPNQSINSSSVAQFGGAWVLVQFNAPTSSSVTTALATAPANNAVVGLTFKFDGSEVTVDGL